MMTPTRYRLTLAVVSLLICTATLVSCSDNSSGSPYPQLPTGDCRSDSDCADAQTCQLDRCVVGGRGASLLVDLLVTPSAASSARVSETSFENVSVITGTTRLDLTVPPPAVLSGQVRFEQSEGGGLEPLEATVFLRAVDGIDGLEFQRSTETDQDGAFTIRVPPGNYDVTVIPLTREDIPERTYTVEALAGNGFVNFVVSRPEDYLKIRGRIVHQTDDLALVPITEASVFAISTTTGSLSSRAPTDSDAEDRGVFEIFVDRDEGPFSLQVRPQRNDAGEDLSRAIPTTSFAAVSPVIIPEDPRVGELPGNGDLIVGRWDEAVFVSGTVRDALGDPIADARVVATSDEVADRLSEPAVPTETSTHTYRTSTDENGRYRALLLAGVNYEIRAGTRESPYQLSDARSILAESGTTDFDLELQPSRMRTVRVTMPGSETPVEGVTVRATPLTFRGSTIAEYGITPDVLADSAITGADGTARLELFAGNYRFSLQAPSSVGVPRSEIRNFVSSRDEEIALQLASGGVIRGRLTTTDGDPISGAAVEVFIDDRTRSVSEAFSAPDGTFSLILPID